MQVGIKDKATKPIVGEMGDDEIGLIMEMVSDPAKLKTFGFPDNVVATAAALKEANADDKPEFPVVRVEEGWSGSHRLWTARELNSIVAQTNTLEPVGHLGHFKDDEAATAFGEPQTTWIGAFAKDELSQQKDRAGEMVRVAYFTGYNYPGAKVRGYIKNKAVRGISWWGNAELVPVPGKGVEVKGFTLKALDWARKLSEGMPTSRIVAIASEMEGAKMDKELAAVTPEEFKRENPNGFALLVAEAVKEKETVIGEMEEAAKPLKVDSDTLAEIRKMLKVPDGGDVLAVIADAMTKLGAKAKEVLANALEAVMLERIPGDEDADKAKRTLVMRLLPTGEMEAKLADAKEDEVDKIVGEMVDAAFDKDDAIKTIIGEQQPPVIRRREQLRTGDTKEAALAGYGLTSERRMMGS